MPFSKFKEHVVKDNGFMGKKRDDSKGFYESFRGNMEFWGDVDNPVGKTGIAVSWNILKFRIHGSGFSSWIM